MAVKHQRALEVYGRTWHFGIGRDQAIIYDPDKKRFVVRLSVLTGRDPEVLARGRWKRTSEGMITPGQVRNYIQRVLA